MEAQYSDNYSLPHSSPNPQQRCLESEQSFLECLLLESRDSWKYHVGVLKVDYFHTYQADFTFISLFSV